MVKFSDVQMRKLQLLWTKNREMNKNTQTAYRININAVHTFEIVLKG